MLDLKQLREHKEDVIRRLNKRGKDYRNDVIEIIELDRSRRELIKDLEELKQERNETSKAIGASKREGKDITPLLARIETDKQIIQKTENKLRTTEENIERRLLEIPNLPHEKVPIGKDETENVTLREEGFIKSFEFPIKPHWDLGVALDILDFKRAAKMSASRFVIYKGLGAKLERALIDFMLDEHLSKGFTELLLPYIVNHTSMTAAGQFPKFKEDAFKLEDERNLYLNPTAEVPGINMHRDEILNIEDLPIKYAAFTTAFRQEAGSAGRDTRGIIRLHQFNKVELLKFTTPQSSYEELESMLEASENILRKLELPYRVIELCSGDLGFSMAKTYDLEVYIPSYETYREIGSISNAEDYQARRGNIRFKRSQDSKTEYVHTLNGSGLAVGRTVVAILENYQQKDGSIQIPTALIPYMKTEVIK